MDALLSRHIAPVATEMLGHFPAILIEGAREVGKSTLAGQIAIEVKAAQSFGSGQFRNLVQAFQCLSSRGEVGHREHVSQVGYYNGDADLGRFLYAS